MIFTALANSSRQQPVAPLAQRAVEMCATRAELPGIHQMILKRSVLVGLIVLACVAVAYAALNETSIIMEIIGGMETDEFHLG